MFIFGFSGITLDNDNKHIQNALKNGLGGIILFANNINSYSQASSLIADLQEIAKIPLFISIDQEGGFVERTINIAKKVDYLTPMALAETKNNDYVELHTQIMAEELKSINVNMNFAPVLDVNTKKDNPVIGIRSFGSNPEDVIKYSKQVCRTFKKNGIIAVGKHFPGHGEASADSHLDMPLIDLSLEELEKTHISPFAYAINDGIDAIMIAHVNYRAFNNDSLIPASLSKEVITDYLKCKLKFSGLIVSDDMVMGGITKQYSDFEACKLAINAGVDILIFRDCRYELIEKIEESVIKGDISEDRINESFNKILSLKSRYNFQKTSMDSLLSPEKINGFRKEIDNIAKYSVKILKKGSLIPVKNKNILILSTDKSGIYNYSKDKDKLSDFLKIYLKNHNIEEISFSLNPDLAEIQKIKQFIKPKHTIIFISYNSILNPGQIKLFQSFDNPRIAILAGISYDSKNFAEADSILLSYCYKYPSLKAIADILCDILV